MIPDVDSGLTFQSFSDLIRSVAADVHDEHLGDSDIFRLFSLFDVVSTAHFVVYYASDAFVEADACILRLPASIANHMLL